MLIADLNTLETIYTLYFTDHIILNCTYTLNSQDIMRIYATFCKFITCFKDLSVCDLDTGSVWNKVSLGFTCFLICNDNFTFLLSVIDNSNTRNLCDDGKTFRLSCLKKLLDTRKTLCDISTGNTTTVESTHGKLCTWLTDRLSSDDTDRFTNLYRLSCSHVCTVTFCTNTYMALTGKNCTDFHCIIWFAFCIYTLCYHSGSTFWCKYQLLQTNTAGILPDCNKSCKEVSGNQVKRQRTLCRSQQMGTFSWWNLRPYRTAVY